MSSLRASLVVVGLSWLLAEPTPLLKAAPFLEKLDLFEGGKGGYQLYRIPGIVVTTKGTILAYAEARRTGKSDWDTIDLLVRRSTDGGKTFDAPRKLAEVPGPYQRNPAALAQKLGRPDDVTYNNPVAVVDQRTGAVHFLFCLEYARCFYLKSDDDGQTFSSPVDITATLEEFRKDYPWRVLATGPGHAIQLKNGRLVVPVWLSPGTGANAHKPSVTAIIYSDDHGQTWQRGAIAVPDTEEFVTPNETAITQLADGRVLLNVRNASKNHRRLVTTSATGIDGWSKPTFQEQLWEPICMASLCRLSEKPTSDRNRLLFANPHTLEPRPGREAQPGVARARQNLSVKLSYDEGVSWPINKTLEAGNSGYSDLAVLPDGTILCLYERWNVPERPAGIWYLTLARFNLEWLSDGQDKLTVSRP